MDERREEEDDDECECGEEADDDEETDEEGDECITGCACAWNCGWGGCGYSWRCCEEEKEEGREGVDERDGHGECGCGGGEDEW